MPVFNAPDTEFYFSSIPPASAPLDTQMAFTDVYNALTRLQTVLVNKCGIGPQNYNNWSVLDNSTRFMQAGNLNRFYAQASEAIAYGAAVNLFLSGGKLKARNANATNNTKPARGFCSVAAGLALNDYGEFILLSGTATIAGLNAGQNYFLSTTNGLVVNTPPVAAGNIEQFLGVALSSTVLAFNLNYWIQH